MAESSNEATSSSSNNNKNNVFDKHVQDENSLKTGTQSNNVEIPWSVRLMIFLLMPSLVGLMGLYMGYLESLRKPERELSFDNDFVMPFLLALAFATVIAFQTRGFTTQKVEPLIKWPKVRRKKVIRKVRKEDLDENDQIIIEEEEQEEEEATEEKDLATKKDD